MPKRMNIFNIEPNMKATISKVKDGDTTYKVEMVVKEELSHVAIVRLREFLKNTNKFQGTSHYVTLFGSKGKKIDQTTLYII